MKRWKHALDKMKHSVIRRSKDMNEISHLNVEIADYHRDINDILIEIGEYVLDNDLLIDDENIAEWFSQIVLLREKIEVKREKLLEIKNVSICSRCGAEYPRDSKVCTKCGNEMGNSTK